MSLPSARRSEPEPGTGRIRRLEDATSIVVSGEPSPPNNAPERLPSRARAGRSLPLTLRRRVSLARGGRPPHLLVIGLGAWGQAREARPRHLRRSLLLFFLRALSLVHQPSLTTRNRAAPSAPGLELGALMPTPLLRGPLLGPPSQRWLPPLSQPPRRRLLPP